MEQKTEASQAVSERKLLDDDGENRAVRTFLMQYGVPSLTVGAMCQHMERSGWGHEYWPPFAKRHPAPRTEHLTKAGAQIWIRYLMSLERAALKAQPAPTEAARDRIPMPTNADQAELMQKLGLAWLQTNAPDRLTDAGRAAQGEDSARLDALEKLRDIAGKLGEVGRWKTAGAMHEAIDVIAAIDRARASAETGGVKP